jgi:hypothetical protein
VQEILKDRLFTDISSYYSSGKENYEVNQNEFASALNEAIMRVFTRHGLNTEKLY